MRPPRRLAAFRTPVTPRTTAILLAVAAGLVTFMATDATADTIYLRNGRVIHAETTQVIDGNLVLSQYGGTVSIPLAAVDRVEKDDTSERGAQQADPPPTDAPEAVPTAAGPAGSTPVDSAGDSSATQRHPWKSPEYWIERIAEVDNRIARVQAELDRLPYYSEVDQRIIVSGQIMYFVAERARWDAHMKRLRAQRDGLERGARRAGVLPGELRAGRRR